MKRLLQTALALCLVCVLSACRQTMKVDTSAWRYYSFEELGVALLLPDDFDRQETGDAFFGGQSAELKLTILLRDELSAGAAKLAAADGSEQEAELMRLGDAALVRLPAAQEDRSAVYDLLGPQGDAYRIRLAVREEAEDKRASALLSTVCESICAQAAVPGTGLSRVIRRTARIIRDMRPSRGTSAMWARSPRRKLPRGGSRWRNISVAAQERLVKSYTQKYGADYVRAYVAVPGYSEHHTGLAIDLYLESPDVWAKILAHLAEYGFILRYPEGKEVITGYSYEPWHVRFVGVETAKEITERAMTLEEYLDAAPGKARS